MRLSKPVDLDDISQALAKGGCPLCTVLRNEQSALLRGGLAADQVTGLCNFHAWALAAVIDSEHAARAFLNALRNRTSQSDPASCSYCSRLLEKEVAELKGLAGKMNAGLVLGWMRQQGALCRMHGDHLRQLAPVRLHGAIQEIVTRTANELETALENLLLRASENKGAGGGVLGRAAEFLTSQRGVAR